MLANRHGESLRADSPAIFRGPNRRSICLFPRSFDGREQRTVITYRMKIHRMLIDMERYQWTCCVKVLSKGNLSRAGFLVLRGRVIAALFGQRGHGGYLFGKDAYPHILNTLRLPGTIVANYNLPEDVVAGAASIFTGEPLYFQKHVDPTLAYSAAVAQLSSVGAPGCVVVTSGQIPICTVFLFGGKLVGAYFGAGGWSQASHEQIETVISQAQDPTIEASILPVSNLDELHSRGFSPTGITEPAGRAHHAFLSLIS